MTALLWDLDGTLMDTGPLVTQLLAEVVRERFTIDQPASYYQKYVGPPFADTVAEYTTDPVEAEAMTRDYMDRYRERMFESPVFDGLIPVLEELSGRYDMAVATSKNEVNARLICDHHDLSRFFKVIRGSNHDAVTKADVIREVLSELGTDDALMIGDRIHDIEGAAQFGLKTIMVGWSAAPHEFDHAWKVAPTPADILTIVEDATR